MELYGEMGLRGIGAKEKGKKPQFEDYLEEREDIRINMETVIVGQRVDLIRNLCRLAGLMWAL